MEELEEGKACGVDGTCAPQASLERPKPDGAPVLDISIVSDVICPWCYVGKKRLEKALDILGPGLPARIAWRPFELNPDMPKEGIERRIYRQRKFGSLERSEALDAQLRAVAAADGITFRHDLMQRTPNTFAAHRLLWRAGLLGVQNALAEVLLRAYFTQGLDVGDLNTLADLAAEAGMDRSESLAFLEGDGGSEDVRAEEAIAHRAGISGVPSFIANGYLLFSGAQQPQVIAKVLQEVASVPQGAAASSATR